MQEDGEGQENENEFINEGSNKILFEEEIGMNPDS